MRSLARVDEYFCFSYSFSSCFFFAKNLRVRVFHESASICKHHVVRNCFCWLKLECVSTKCWWMLLLIIVVQKNVYWFTNVWRWWWCWWSPEPCTFTSIKRIFVYRSELINTFFQLYKFKREELELFSLFSSFCLLSMQLCVLTYLFVCYYCRKIRIVIYLMLTWKNLL